MAVRAQFDRWLLWHADWSSGVCDSFRSTTAAAERELGIALARLEEALSAAPWLSGQTYGLADISWVVNANRLAQAEVDLSRWPKFEEWSRRAISRPAFDRAVVSYRP